MTSDGTKKRCNTCLSLLLLPIEQQLQMQRHRSSNSSSCLRAERRPSVASFLLHRSSSNCQTIWRTNARLTRASFELEGIELREKRCVASVFTMTAEKERTLAA